MGTPVYPPVTWPRGTQRRSTLPDVISIPAEARGRLAEVAAAEGLSVRAYLTNVAEGAHPSRRRDRAEQARGVPPVS
jgi:hypothetical protein